MPGGRLGRHQANQSNANPSTRITNTRREERNVFDGHDETVKLMA